MAGIHGAAVTPTNRDRISYQAPPIYSLTALRSWSREMEKAAESNQHSGGAFEFRRHHHHNDVALL